MDDYNERCAEAVSTAAGAKGTPIVAFGGKSWINR